LVAFNYLIAIWLAAGLASQSHVAASSLVTHALSWLLVPVCLHLHLIIPTSLFRRRPRYALPVLYVIATILAALEFGQFLPDSLSYIAFFLAVLVSLGLLIWRAFGRSSPLERSTATLMLAGIGLALGPGMVLGIVPNLLDPSVPGVLAIGVALLAAPILPMVYTYAIYKRRLGPLEFRANRLLSAYSFVLLCATIFVLVFLGGSYWLGLPGESIVFSFFVSLVFVIAGSALFPRFRKLVDRLVYGTKHNPDEIIRIFANQIPAASSLEALTRLLTEEVAPSLLIRQSALWSLADGEFGPIYTSGVDADGMPGTRQQIDQLLAEAGRYRPILTEGVEAADDDIDRRALSWVRLAIPLEVRKQAVGIWLFGRRDPDDYYPREDIALLTTLADQVTVALENIRLYERARREIADRKQAETALRLERDRAQRYLDVAGVILVALDEEAKIVLLNRRGHEILGYEEGELVGRVWFDTCLPERIAEQRRRVFRSLMAGKAEQPAYHTSSVLTKSGQERTIAWHNTILRHESGKPMGTLSSGEDITERIEAEEARTRLVAAVDQAGEAIVILDDLGRIQYVNPAFEKITGYTREGVLGQELQMLVSEGLDTSLYSRLWAMLARGEAWAGRLAGDRKDGMRYEAEVSISPVYDASRESTEYVIILRDVTEQTSLEARLRQALKMEVIGQLAGGIAHDFNNLLTAIIGYADFAHSNLPQDSPLEDDLRGIIETAGRAAALTRQLLAFSRKQILQPIVLEINDVVTNMHRMLRRLIREDIELVTVLAPGLGLVEADPGQLEQVIVNLVINARDAMPKGGTLTLRTSNVDLDETYTRQYLDVDPGPYVVLAVSDDGIGMTRQVRSHIFEPFFTTKEDGKGTGLGLATVYGIVKQSGGHVDVDSEPGVGTTFRIYLPRLSIEPHAIEPEKAEQVIPTGTGRILLVEDEDSVRTLVRRVLEEQGYEVLEAGLPSIALQIAEDAKEPIHVLVTDVVMPEMSGRQLADRLATIRPETRVLYMSGYADDEIVDKGVLGPDVVFLEKPFTPEALARKVHQVLSGPSEKEGPPPSRRRHN
jgi:PAS domain S-box-containing protein